jgi:hypothetical protein
MRTRMRTDFEEDPRTGAVMAVKVGAPKTQIGLLNLYHTEASRLESVFDGF